MTHMRTSTSFMFTFSMFIGEYAHETKVTQNTPTMKIKKKDLLIKDCSLRRQDPRCGKDYRPIFDKGLIKFLKDAWWKCCIQLQG